MKKRFYLRMRAAGVFFVMLMSFLMALPKPVFAAQSTARQNLLLGVAYTADVSASAAYPDSGTELTDGMYAGPYLNETGWQGRDSVGTYSFTADLGKETRISGFKANFFKYQGAGVLTPDSVVLSGSSDGAIFEELCQGATQAPAGDAVAVPVEGTLPVAATCRYVRLTISGNMWSFIDEWELYDIAEGTVPDPNPGTHPCFAGSFLQPDLPDSWSDAQWRQEFDWMQLVGMNHLVLQWTANSKSMTSIFPTALSGFAQNTRSDLVAKTLAMSEEHGFQVYLGLQLNEDWFGKYTNDAIWLANQADLAVDLAAELWKNYGTSPAFAGWYLSFEVDNWNLQGPAQWQAMADFYNRITDYTNSLPVAKPVMISPFFNIAGGLSTTGWQSMWEYILSRTDIDILALQDGVGAGHATAADLPAWFAAIGQAIQNSGASTILWADSETFNLGRQPMPIGEMVQDMKAVQPYVQAFTSFSFNHYLSPQAVPRLYYDTYSRYVDTGLVDNEAPSAPQAPVATAQDFMTVQLGWQPATDNMGIAGYNVYRDNVLVKQTYGMDSAFSDMQLDSGKSYAYTVSARDAAGNESPQSAAALVSTPTAPLYSNILSSGSTYTYQSANPNNDPENSKLTPYKDLNCTKLTDGISGSLQYDDGTWVGFENGKPITLTIDLGTLQTIHELSAEFIQVRSAYIFLPASVQVEVSADGVNYTEMGTMGQPALGLENQVKPLRMVSTQGVNGRYVRLTVQPGSFAWTFMDEVVIKA